jgi:hypothetical protein
MTLLLSFKNLNKSENVIVNENACIWNNVLI